MLTISEKPGRSSIISRFSTLTLLLLLLSNLSAFAQKKNPTEIAPSVYSNPLFILLICIAIMLLLVILIFANMLMTAAATKNSQLEKNKNNFSQGIKSFLLIFSAGLLSSSLSAQNITAVAISTEGSYWGLGSFTFYSLITIIGFEIFIAWLLYNLSMSLLGVKERLQKEASERKKAMAETQQGFFEKFNASVAVEKEADIMMDHDYDGIKELDNNLPPWWVWGFFLTIVFSFVYLIHYQVLHTGQSPDEEYAEQIAKGKADAEEYRKKAANLVDENNATLLTDKSSLESGRTSYLENCSPCHGKNGEGSVGPNLTDDYWQHKGGLKDIFRTIKYGWPEKGMKAWEQDLGAKQIHELASYIKSLRGTNPANPKEPQGELYTEEMTRPDSLQVDSASATLPDTILVKEKK